MGAKSATPGRLGGLIKVAWPMADDKELIQRILSGERNCFRELITRYQRLVTHLVFRMVPVSEDREDICQEVFLKVYQNLADFRYESKLSTWIARVAYNTCLNYIEKKKVPLYDDLVDKDSEFEPVDDDLGHQPDAIAEAAEISELLQVEIDRLPHQYRVLITLYHLEEMSYTEIAGITKLPEGTVKSYLFRARQILKKRLSSRYRQKDLI